MVKFFETNFSYDYQWPAVTLAYFLRYPNPYSTHVVSSDTLSSFVNPETGNLHITRLHLKRGKLPASVARFIPKIKESYILERSVIDARNQRMCTESRNLDWEGVLSVVENQEYVPAADPARTDVKTIVKFESRLGHRKREEEKRGFFQGWGTSGVRASLEVVGRSRMRDGLMKSREGMKLVLEQLRERGFVGVVKEQRQGGWERWKKVWRGDHGMEEAR
ncbi:MSF1-domain-containing protein [Ascodesmis nigricans]|uniref:MSF1-domain-containing protein n=1 Tax=Ascodesmis nigricans TaxID=341454 RepID=A0A4S2N476_9PEZI|nr:MSF1-domain-containing protein [Ascodesmis nigricans]